MPDWWTAEESEASFGAVMNPLLSVDTNDVGELPEVVAAGRQGFAPAPEAPMWCFLPVVWPDAHRAWVLENFSGVLLVQETGGQIVGDLGHASTLPRSTCAIQVRGIRSLCAAQSHPRRLKTV